MFQKSITNKLFYDKWPYKITCKMPGITLLRSFGPTFIFSLTPENIVNYTWSRYITVNVDRLKNFVKLLENFINDKDVKKRIEGDKISFYFLTKKEYNEFLNCATNYVTHITEPSDDTALEILQQDTNYIICDNLPHNKFKYKITFKDMPQNVRKNLILWAEKYNSDNIHITKSTKIHFHGIKHHYGSHYFYINDPKMISFITLAASGYIRRIDEFITREFVATV